ncbi:MAG: type II toxin-antitoxin system RelE/ParE family toxin [Acidobacteriaceae bacterium]
MVVRWTASARRDFNEQLEYIADRNFSAAQRLRIDVLHHTAMLSDSPEMGRVGRQADSRELVITGTPYVAVYRIRKQYVQIFRLLHGTQQWPPPQPAKR